jgi:hypothetical protein
MLWAILAYDALAGTRHKPRVIEMSPTQLRQAKLKLRWRWVKNLLAGRPEPRFPDFDVQAVGVVWEASYRRVLTLSSLRGHSLPRVTCNSDSSPWDQLAGGIQQASGVLPAFRWVGLLQDSEQDKLEFVFAATMKERDLSEDAAWSTVRNAGLGDRDMAYVERVKPSYARDAVWSMVHQPDLEQGETIGGKEELV